MTNNHENFADSAIAIFTHMIECVQEHKANETEETTFWSGIREHGIGEFRQTAIDLTKPLETTWGLLNLNDSEIAFDICFVPEMLCAAVQNDNQGFLQWPLEKWMALGQELYA